MEAKCGNVCPINDNPSSCRLNDPEEGKSQRRLARPGSTDNADPLATISLEGDVLENQIQSLLINQKYKVPQKITEPSTVL